METVFEQPQDSIPIGNESFVADHINGIKQIIWGFFKRTVPNHFVHVLRLRALLNFAMLFKKPFIAFWANGRTKKDSRLGNNGLYVERVGLRSLPVKNLAIIARFVVLVWFFEINLNNVRNLFIGLSFSTIFHKIHSFIHSLSWFISRNLIKRIPETLLTLTCVLNGVAETR